MTRTLEESEAEVERLLTLNDRLARQVLAAGARLEEGRRELLATGWDNCAKLPTRPDLKDNPHRKPVIDFSGAMICKTSDDA
jgi:hypothetical protein